MDEIGKMNEDYKLDDNKIMDEDCKIDENEIKIQNWMKTK